MKKMIELVCAYSGEKFSKEYGEYKFKLKNGQTKFYKNKQNLGLAQRAIVLSKRCKRCDKQFHNQVNTFCSRKCANTHVLTDETRKKIALGLARHRLLFPKPPKIPREIAPRQMKCKICGIEYMLYNKQSATTCSMVCRKARLSQMGKKSAQVQSETRRSLNEKCFYELCVAEFKNVENNKAIFNGWDADIIIHDVKVAILWNGKWHYEKITQKHSVAQVQNRDKIKMAEIIKLGYVPYIIKDMGRHDQKFVKLEFQKFLALLGG